MSKKKKTRSDSKKELYKLIIARSDVTLALKACKLLINRVDDFKHELYVPLFHTIAVSYSRPFSKNKPHGPLPKKWRNFDDLRLQKAHEDLIEARNQFIAHSDEDIRIVEIYPPASLIPTLGTYSSDIAVSIRNIYYPLDRFPDFRDTCFNLGNRLNAEVEKLLEVLYSKRVLPASAFRLTFDNGL